MISFQQVINFREILLCSTLSERAVKIEFQQYPGPHLQTMLKLLQLIQTGCKIDVNTKGIIYIPGIITNQDGMLQTYNCGVERSISYYLEILLILSLFGKAPLNIELNGITNDQTDQSVDSIINAYIPLIKKFCPEWDVSLKVTRRGFLAGTGTIILHSKPIKQIQATTIIERGPICKIRGVCSGSKVAPNLLNRVVSQCRNVFNDYIPDVWIHTDLQKSQKGIEFQNGYAVSLIAESTNGLFISCDCEYSNDLNNPEKVGETAALRLLDEIKNCGCFDTTQQQFALLMMAISQRKVSQIKLGRISTHTIETLRIIRSIFGVTFNIEDSVFSCIGCGLMNLSRQTQ
ncbi:unnamed protein product [Paramecium primaurelia]|uniref:RNA 3'-terminal phosphate cyclase-like protein n=1 Tax=Paramecium primaurelia TaxID=5886 RepID=A0A8S1JSB3_PARPR|nr:unnamed protein product [Paramecium primaurelia]